MECDQIYTLLPLVLQYLDLIGQESEHYILHHHINVLAIEL